MLGSIKEVTMSIQTIAFPKELERHVLRDINRELIYIIIICYTLALTACFVMSQISIDLTNWEQNQALPNITVPANVEITPIQSKVDKTLQPKNISRNNGVLDLVSHISNVKRTGQELNSALSNIGSIAFFKQAGGQQAGTGGNGTMLGNSGWGGGSGLGRNGNGNNTGMNAPGLVANSVGADLSRINVIGVNAGDAQKANRLDASGVYIEGKLEKSKIDLASLSPTEVENLIANAKVQPRLIAKVVGSQGEIPTAKGRTAEDVQAKMQSYSMQIKACYTSVLRRDPNLIGEVAFSFTIKPNGTVANIQITSDSWSDSALGKQVETGMRERIANWKFDAVAPMAGDLTVNYSYLFTR
jgi:hypothetical protein